MTRRAGAAEVRAVVGGPRSGVLELAVLGLLHDTPMHGYELRKRLNALLGAFRAFGYGSLYPCLKELLAQGLIVEEQPSPVGKPLAGRRSKIVYRLTAEGKERLDGVRAAMARTRERLDSYTLELHRHGLESVEREVRWLNELIASERQSGTSERQSSGEPSRHAAQQDAVPHSENETSAGDSAD